MESWRKIRGDGQALRRNEYKIPEVRRKKQKTLQDLHKVERLKEIVEENTYRNQVMSYMKDEMPEFAEKMDQDYEAAKQMYESRDVTLDR